MTATHHNADATEYVVNRLREDGRKPRRNGKAGWVASCPCPAHGKGNGDRNPSLSVSEGRDGNAVLYCHAGCNTDDILAALRLEPGDLFAESSRDYRGDNVRPLTSWTPAKQAPKPNPPPTSQACDLPACASARKKEGAECVARYVYTDHEGQPLGVVHRWDPKTFRPATKDENGAWVLRGTITVIYAAPRVMETLAADGTVLIVEGEKDADTVNALGLADLCATTNAMGAQKWTKHHAEQVAGIMEILGGRGRVVVCGDDDEAGRKHVAATLEAFAEVGAPEPMVVYPQHGKDVTEHLDNGGNLILGDPHGLHEPWTYTRLGKILTLEDLEALPPIRWGVEDWISSPSAVLLVGGYAVGKSALILSMGCSVASGTPFLGHEVERRRVLYVFGEGSHGLPRRVQAWKQTWDRDLADDAITFMKKPAGSLREPATWDEIGRYCRSEGIGMCILDTFSSLAPEADETKDAAVVVAGLNGLTDYIDGPAILVHHPGWAQTTQDRARGGYQLEGNVDEVLILSAVAEGSDHIGARIKKRKDGEDGAIHYLRRIAVHLNGPDGKPAYDDRGNPITAVTVEHARLADTAVPLRTRILTYLTARGELGGTPKEIAGQIGADPASGGFGEALRVLTGSEEIRCEGSTRSRRYFITEDA